MEMSGKQYADLIAAYLSHNYSNKGIKVHREISVGKSIIGKNRRVDLLVLFEPENKALVIECKYQQTSGTVDEKIPYALDDLKAMKIPGCICYAGEGFSLGVLHMLQASGTAVRCLPDREDLNPSKETQELDHFMAMTFGWWDVLVKRQ